MTLHTHNSNRQCNTFAPRALPALLLAGGQVCVVEGDLPSHARDDLLQLLRHALRVLARQAVDDAYGAVVGDSYEGRNKRPTERVCKLPLRSGRFTRVYINDQAHTLYLTACGALARSLRFPAQSSCPTPSAGWSIAGWTYNASERK